ncbi:pilus assembly protein PilM [bacterium]|nr:pilus assembly protein PilM [bacterium]
MARFSFNPIKPLNNFLLSFLSKYSVQQEEVIGLDLTPRSVNLIQLSKSGSKWTVEKMSYRAIEGVDDIKNNTQKYADEISVAFKSGKFSTTNAAISLPVSTSIIKVIPIPLMNEDEMQKAIEFDSLWENLTQLPDALTEYSIFHQVIRKDASKNMMDVLFVASKLSEVNFYVDVISKAGINPIVLDVKCFALRNAFETKNLSKLSDTPLAILEMGEFENFLMIIKDDSPYVSDIFVGANDKKLIGSPDANKQTLSQIVNRYVMQIKQNLNAYTNRFETGKINNIFIVSQSPNIKEITKLLEEQLKEITFINFDPLSDMIMPAQIKEKIQVVDNKSTFTSSIGLATRKLDIFGYYKKVTGVKNINLLPNRETIKKTQRTKLISGIFFGTVAVIIIFFALYLSYGFYKKININNDELIDYSMNEMEINSLQETLFNLQNKKREIEKKLELTKTATTNQLTAAKVLSDLAYSAGPGIAFVEIKYEGGEMYSVKGEALNDKTVVNYINEVREKEIFNKVVLEKSSIAKEGSKIKTFIVKVYVKQELMNTQNIQEENN